jgi:hypothetical protein
MQEKRLISLSRKANLYLSPTIVLALYPTIITGESQLHISNLIIMNRQQIILGILGLGYQNIYS